MTLKHNTRTTTLMWPLGALIYAILCVMPGMAIAQSHEKTPKTKTTSHMTLERKQVRLLLTAHHSTPNQAAFKKASPTHARALLLEAAHDQHLFPTLRVRALDALGAHWAGADIFIAYNTTLKNALHNADEGTIHRVLMLGAKHLGTSFVPVLTPYLKHKEVQVRRTAVAALMLVGDDRSRSAIEAVIDDEKSEFVRKHMTRALRTVR